MGHKTQNQKDNEIRDESARLRLVGKAREVLKILGDEESIDALNVLSFIAKKINTTLTVEAEKKLIKDICPEDFKT